MSRYGVPFSKGPEVRLAAHPQSCELSELKAFAEQQSGTLAIDLFCGAGGLSLGLHMAGFNVILAADKELEAAQTHRAHFPGASLHGDLGDPEFLKSICDALEGVEVDLVAGGPPCQPYSQAAFSKVRHLQRFHGRGEDSRRTLWSSFLEVVRKTTPRAVLVENVPDMAFGRDGVVLRRLVADLEDAGYVVHSRVLASDAFGVPQHRQRLFVVGLRDGLEFEWPREDPRSRRVLWDAIGDLPPVEAGDKREKRPYTGEPTDLQRYYRDGVEAAQADLIFDHYTRAVRADDLEAFRLMTPSTRYSDLPDHLKRYRDDIFEDKYKRLDGSKLCRTITAHISQDGYWYIHPEEHRTLTIREAARIQTFPDWFRFCGYPRHAFKQIGEAVPPLLGKAVATAIKQALDNNHESRHVFSTRKISRVAVDWLLEQPKEMMIYPWLNEDDLWLRLLGFLLFDRATPRQVAEFYWTACHRWPNAQALQADPDASSFAEQFAKADSFFALKQVAAKFEAESAITLELLTEGGVSNRIALRFLASCGLTTQRPATGNLQRLAQRGCKAVIGVTDGRGSQEMLLGRLTGIDEDGSAYRALQEVGARFCKSREPQCRFCPLASACLWAQQLPPNSPGRDETLPLGGSA